jgi:hypothetical protein
MLGCAYSTATDSEDPSSELSSLSLLSLLLLLSSVSIETAFASGCIISKAMPFPFQARSKSRNSQCFRDLFPYVGLSGGRQAECLEILDFAKVQKSIAADLDSLGSIPGYFIL